MNSTTTVAPSTCFDHRNEFLRLETRLSQVVLERPVCLVALVVDGQPDDEVDVRRADMRACTLGQAADDVARRQTAGQVDAVTPWAHVAE